ncbi:MAG: hypothetical protein JO112_17080 [Planctomycetes bacterium]|nr:hypothetical protein [Planctomycetota bacterium]
MPAKWLMYIPRNRSLAEMEGVGKKPSLVAHAQGWQSYVEAKVASKGQGRKYDFFVRCYQEGWPGPLGDEDVIYLFGGHGLENRDAISWPGDQDNLMSSQEVAHRLVSEGLTTDFGGRIKVYSSHSSEHGDKAFAQLFAHALRAKNYLRCSIFGYAGEITFDYELIDLHQPAHQGKFQGEAAEAGTHRWSILKPPFYAGRASKHRTQY